MATQQNPLGQQDVLLQNANPGHLGQVKPNNQPGWDPGGWLSRLSQRAQPTNQPRPNDMSGYKGPGTPGAGTLPTQGNAQDMARRILPHFNNGNPAGANNLPSSSRGYQRRSPYQSEQQIRELGASMGASDDWMNTQISRLQGQQNPMQRGGGQQRVHRDAAFADPEGFRQWANDLFNSDLGRRTLAESPGYEDEVRQLLQEMPGQGQQGMGQGTMMPNFNSQDIRNRAIGIGQYYGGQNPGAGRYRPPTQDRQGNWQDSGGYNYNLPNAYGSYPGYGQGDPGAGNRGPGSSSMYGGNGDPRQFQDMLQQLMRYLQGGGG